MKSRLQLIDDTRKADNAPEIASRIPYFCSGCPHNSSTKVPEGSRAYAGIGCHFMAQWMDRSTVGFTQMGGEGANWIGEAPFSTTGHVFQNIGDGTYNHSGVLAIRAAVAAGTTMTYKILFNDAVAMTGGQKNEGGLTAARIAHEVKAIGVGEIAVVYDEKEDIDLAAFPAGVPTYHREKLMDVQEKLSKVKGVSVLLYVQTCAAEKRRRRKRGQFPDPDRRVFINTDVCEGCGDCGVQSNCVSIVPVETEFGTKRAIDQSSCNKDFSCLQGFCPSFVTVEGAKLKKREAVDIDLGVLPEPQLPAIDGTFNVVITGVGGTGVVTVGATLAMAAHLDGKGAGMMEMAGLAQKGGAVHIHCRIGKRPEDITAIRVATGEADALIGGDLVVSAGAKTLGLTSSGRTGAVVNSHQIVTGDFTRNRDLKLPFDQLELALRARLRDRLHMIEASALAERLLGDSIFANMVTFGAAWQAGLIPVSQAAIARAVELNGAAVEKNHRAFQIGRWSVANPQAAAVALASDVQAKPNTAAGRILARRTHLVAYQGEALALRYDAMLARFEDPKLKEAVAKGYHKLLTYKDEYEVARLHLSTAERTRAAFDGDLKLRFHLAPPFLPGVDAEGRPKKRTFGPWMLRVFSVLAAMKGLRGTVIDPFGWSAERRAERALIAAYEADMDEVLRHLADGDRATAVDLAELPLQIRGFGPVKQASIDAAAVKRAALKAALASDPKAVAAE